jgi:hypothetical protein
MRVFIDSKDFYSCLQGQKKMVVDLKPVANVLLQGKSLSLEKAKEGHDRK